MSTNPPLGRNRLVAARWIIVPIEQNSRDGDTYTYPKYWDTAGLTGYSGAIVDFSADEYSDLPWYPDEMYVTRFYGPDSALDVVAANDDAYGKAEYDITDEEVASYLNDKFGESYSFQEWLSNFNINIP